VLRSSLPQQDGTVQVAGVSARVTIERDDRGVPTIRAASLDDAAFAIGFCACAGPAVPDGHDAPCRRRAALEIVGAQALPVDKLMRTLGLYATAAQQARDASPQLKQVLASYSAG